VVRVPSGPPVDFESTPALADGVEVSTLPIAEFSSNGEHIAGIADTKARLVREMDGEIQSLPSSMV
jgi:hypothetical protein